MTNRLPPADAPDARRPITYIEPEGATAARIGRVAFSRNRQTACYAGRRLLRDGDRYRDAATGERFRLAGPDAEGHDADEPRAVLIDEDVRVDYWRTVRGRVLPIAAV